MIWEEIWHCDLNFCCETRVLKKSEVFKELYSLVIRPLTHTTFALVVHRPESGVND